MKNLNIGEGTNLPLDFITESSAILAKKGAGKTNAAIVLMEEVHKVGVPVISIDPKGDHWGIRGGSPEHPDAGLPFVVFGGLHGDVPLEPSAGAYIAGLLRGRAISAVLDVSEFTIGERAKFLTTFADGLYRRPEKYPMMLMLEEAHEYIPQAVRADEARMVGAFERLVKLGRHKGLGVVMVTQRSASLNKNVLTQADNLFILRTTSPQDRAAVKAWMDSNAEAAQVISEMPSLGTGECWLIAGGVPSKFRWRMRDTYDAGATPKVGESLQPPAALAEVNLEQVRTDMAATIESQKANDPKLLKKEVARLTALVAEMESAAAELAPAPTIEYVDRDVLNDDDRASIAALANQLEHVRRIALEKIRPMQVVVPAEFADKVRFFPLPAGGVDRAAPVFTPVPSSSAGHSDVVLTGPERKILTALAPFGTRSHKQLAVLAGYKPSSSGFKNPLAHLRSTGLVTGGGDAISITQDGFDALGDYEPLPTGRALVEHWLSKLTGPEARILTELIKAYPEPLTAVELAERAGYVYTSSGFKNPLAKLRSHQLAHGGGSGITAAEELGEAGA